MSERTPTPEELGLDPDASPFEVPPISGLPFGKDSEEAKAIERILAWPEDPSYRTEPED